MRTNKLIFFLGTLLFVSCTPSWKKATVTEPLKVSQIQQMDTTERNYYEWIFERTQTVGTALLIDYVNVTYQDVFDLFDAVFNHQKEWQHEAASEWTLKYGNVVDKATEYFSQWEQWEIDNQLSNKIHIKLKDIEETGTHTAFFVDLKSDLGALNFFEGALELENEHPSRRSRYICVRSDTLFTVLNNYPLKAYAYAPPEAIETMTIEEIPFSYHISKVTTDEETLDYDYHHKQIPSIALKAIKAKRQEKVENFNKLKEFYTYFVSNAAIQLNLDYMSPTTFCDAYFDSKCDKINVNANKFYKFLKRL